MSFTTTAEIKQFQGTLYKLAHESTTTKTKMEVNVFVPPTKSSKKTPVLVYLSGLTCTPNNASEKSFLAYFATKYGFAIVFPDTSPRGANIAGEDDSWDFGTGAGFYVDATTEPWKNNYNMYSYVHKELLTELAKHFTDLDFKTISITGHSMGGMGALTGFLKNPGTYKSVSAFAPISNPSTCPWGEKNFGNYLGEDKEQWNQYDPTYLIKEYKHENQPTILIHQGTDDTFYKQKQLQPENFVEASTGYKGGVKLNLVDGYDHSYFFISTFVEEHAKHHAKYLGLIE
ncbi:Alpha/Beta hydrolase protein [Scheffersomyces xylosifermentans]|uniref:Alpha/Beta hydrolase protein n=1 Tax=Scheffersomyces xylosifermentans TaxID=1304137 RepID=UPI00315D17F0